jgi:hypothetical protein
MDIVGWWKRKIIFYRVRIIELFVRNHTIDTPNQLYTIINKCVGLS